MTKQIFEDFIIKAKKSEPVLPPKRERISEDILSSSRNRNSANFFNGKNIIGFAIVIVLCLLGFFQASKMFSSVVVKITPIEENIILNDIFTASLNKDDSGKSVQYKLMKVEESESSLITASKGETVSKKASGEIIVYNAYSEAVQPLITGTRFETPDGKIYKINKAIVVPGRKTVNGKVVPGSLVATVYASAPGEEYNIPASDFTLPGLKDSPRYKSVYARGKGDITGGFVGEMKKISPEEISSAKKKLAASLIQKLETKAKNQTPAGYVFYNDASFISLNDNSDSLALSKNNTSDKVSLTTIGTMDIVIFNEKELASFIARNKLPEVKDNNVHSPTLSKLDFKILNKSNLNILNDKSFSFKISGNAKIVWDFNIADFKQNLAGLDKDKYQEIFKKYVMIEKAETVFKPSWSGTFPSDPKRITVELQGNQ